MRAGAIAVAIGLGVSAAGAAQADSASQPLLQPTERIASTGWYAEGGLGAVGFLPSTNQDAAVGPAIDLRFGRDLFSWLSVGIFAAASTHQATLPPPPTGQYFQLYRMGADARLSARFGSIGIFVEGELGAAVISTNVLDQVMITKPGSYTSLALGGGAGVEYQLENRHYGIGLAGDAAIEPQFASIKAVDVRLYLRYTY
jgi:opacity protein-like surface antigen